MSERLTPEREAEIRSKLVALGKFTRLTGWERACADVLAELDAVRAEKKEEDERYINDSEEIERLRAERDALARRVEEIATGEYFGSVDLRAENKELRAVRDAAQKFVAVEPQMTEPASAGAQLIMSLYVELRAALEKTR